MPPEAPPPVASPAQVRAPKRDKRDRRPPPPQHATLTDRVLPSGLRLLLDEDPHATTAGVVSVVAGGSSTDPPGAEGLAHLVEHLSYRAVDPTPAGQRPTSRGDRLTRLGAAEMNGYTTRDAVIFYEFAASSALRALFDLETARLADPLAGVGEEAVVVERQVVASEHLVRDDPRAGSWAANALVPLLFPPGHPYARATGGTEESIHRLTLAQARTFAASSFRPDRMTVLVAAPPGVTSLDALAARLPAALRGDAQRPVARLVPAPEVLGPAAPGGARVEHRSSPLPTPELWIGWRLPGAIGDARATEDVLARWLQRDVGAEAVLEEEPKIRSVRVDYQPGVSASVLLLRVLVAPGASPEKVAQIVVARVASLWSREPTDQDTFADMRGLYETAQLFEEPPQVSRALGEAMTASTSAERAQPSIDSWAALQAVKSATVAKLAYEHLGREKARAVMFTPAPPGPEAAQRGAAPAPGGAAAEAARELVPGAAAWDARELDAFAPDPDEVTTTKLDNGLTVVTDVREGRSAVAWLAFRGGYSDADPPLLAELAVRARPDARQATRLHILTGRGATRDFTWDMVQFLPAQLPEALTLLFAKAVVPVRDWPSADGLARLLAPLAADEDALTTQADAAFWRALFGEHPHARAVKTTDLDKLSRSDVEAWLGRVHATRNAALVVVGDVDPDEVVRAAKVLSAHIKSPSFVPDVAVPAAVAPRAPAADHVVPVLTARPGALTDIRLGCLLPPMSAADAGQYDALKNALQARLNDALRFEHGDSYGVAVEVHRLRGGTTFLVAATSVAADGLARSLGALHANWQRWGRAGFGDDEMNVARWRYGATLPFRDASEEAIAGQLLDRWAVNPAELTAGPVEASVFADARAFQAKRASELFATCRSNAVLGVTGSEPLIQRALEQGWPGLGHARSAP